MPAEADLQKKYQPGKLYLVEGGLLTQIIAMIRRYRPRSGANVTVKEDDTGSSISARGDGTGKGGATGTKSTYLVVVNGDIAYQDFLVSGPVRSTYDPPA